MAKGNLYSKTHKTTVCDNHARTHVLSSVYANATVYVANHQKKRQIAYSNIHFVDKYVAKIKNDSVAKENKKLFFIDEIYDSNGIVYYRSSRYSDALLLVTPSL